MQIRFSLKKRETFIKTTIYILTLLKNTFYKKLRHTQLQQKLYVLIEKIEIIQFHKNFLFTKCCDL